MPIKTKCRKCRRAYTVKDELAGKKFRCKECQSPVTVPQPAVPLDEEPDEDEDELFASGGLDSFGDDFGDDFDDDFDDDAYDTPVVPRPRKKKKKSPPPKKKRKRRSSSSSSGGVKIGAIFGGLAGVVGILIVIAKISMFAGAAGGFDFNVLWQTYTTTDGNISLLMPGTAKRVPVASLGPGGQSYGVTKRSSAYIISTEPMIGQLAGMSESELFDAFDLGSGFIGAKNVQRIQKYGRNCITFEKSAPGGIKSNNIAFLYKDKVYTLNYAYKGTPNSSGRKFFDSVKFK
ncbi:hypothetical protein [Thalassoglobus sp.]|uniref:hypothetical protein n=1 Tax=Thalassoglobus sp. TaxID=2795869 RepID=UPI003AA9BF31